MAAIRIQPQIQRTQLISLLQNMPKSTRFIVRKHYSYSKYTISSWKIWTTVIAASSSCRSRNISKCRHVRSSRICIRYTIVSVGSQWLCRRNSRFPMSYSFGFWFLPMKIVSIFSFAFAVQWLCQWFLGRFNSNFGYPEILVIVNRLLHN